LAEEFTQATLDRALAYRMNGCIEMSEIKPIKSLNYWMMQNGADERISVNLETI